MDEPHKLSDSEDLNLYAVGNQFVVEVPVPGIKPRDIEVSLEDRTLTIRAQVNGTSECAERTYLCHGYQPVSLVRRIQLPDGVDRRSGRGSLEVGLLRVRFRQDGLPSRPVPVRADSPASIPLRRAEPNDAPTSPGSSASSEPPSDFIVGDGQPKTLETVLLSPREQEVLRLMVDGHTNKEIARQLIISVSTVNYHVASILTKLGAENRTQAATITSQHPLLLEARCPD